MNTPAPSAPTGSARWVAALLISGVGLAGLGYSLASRPTPSPPQPVFVPESVAERTSGSQVGDAGTATPAAAPGDATDAASPARNRMEPPTRLGTGMTLDLNSATEAELQLLPGIGPARAASIVRNREAMGPFATVEDLARIRGIGPATVEGVRPYVTLGPAGGGG